MSGQTTNAQDATTPPASEWFVIPEVCREAKCGPKLVYREIKAGRLRAARLGGRRGPIRIHRSWVREWLEASARMLEI